MRKLIYSMTVSLDGFIAGPGGDISWSAPDEELHRFHNDQVRELGAASPGAAAVRNDGLLGDGRSGPIGVGGDARLRAIRQALPKVVFSRTLDRVEGKTTLAAGDVADEVARLKQEPGADLAVGGAGLASELIVRNLIDDYRLFVSPVVLGAGTPYFPALERPIHLELVETRTFAGRVEYRRYVRPRRRARSRCCSGRSGSWRASPGCRARRTRSRRRRGRPCQ